MTAHAAGRAPYDDSVVSFRQTWLWPFILLSIPPVIWLFIALSYGYALEADNAQIAIRTHDIFSKNPPLLGMPSTAGNEVGGVELFHPGPLHFILLAPLYALSGFSAWGILVGSLALNLGLVAIGLWVAWKTESMNVRRAAVISFTVMGLSLQSLMFTPWNPFPVALGAPALTLLVVGIVSGRPGLWPWVVVVGSLVAQSHLVGAVFVLALVSITAVLLFSRRRARTPSAAEIVLAVILLAACWVLPVWEIVTNWSGNAGELLKYVFSDSDWVYVLDPNINKALGVFRVVATVSLLVCAFIGFYQVSKRGRSARAAGSMTGGNSTILGLLVASFISLVSGALIGSSDRLRGPYLLLLLGVWILQAGLIYQRKIQSRPLRFFSYVVAALLLAVFSVALIFLVM